MTRSERRRSSGSLNVERFTSFYQLCLEWIQSEPTDVDRCKGMEECVWCVFIEEAHYGGELGFARIYTDGSYDGRTVYTARIYTDDVDEEEPFIFSYKRQNMFLECGYFESKEAEEAHEWSYYTIKVTEKDLRCHYANYKDSQYDNISEVAPFKFNIKGSFVSHPQIKEFVDHGRF